MSESIVRRGAVAILVRQGRFLVIRRSQHVVAPGAYCFPGGGIEGDESEPAALVRELHEELGIVVRPVARVWESVTPWRVALAWWLAEWSDELHALAPNPAEVESVHWLLPTEMAALPALLTSNREFLAALDRGEIAIAGLTAAEVDRPPLPPPVV
ncbi:MAG: NUDIX domain-containing protein [Pirellulales bacterium]|nr:NUDIX domain-containing protein [Pirellulales bacterium]